MPYAKLLTQLIEERGLTIKEVAERCNNLYNQKITAAYISIIKNSNDEKIPSDDVSRALAKACEAKYADILVIEAYIDKAPKEILHFFNSIRAIIARSFLMVYTNVLSNDEINIAIQKLNEMPLAELILESQDMFEGMSIDKLAGSMETTIKIGDTTEFIGRLTEPQGFVVNDNSMFPIIKEGSKINPELLPIDEYKNGDILAVRIKKAKQTICRNCLFLDEPRTKIALYAFDKQYEAETYNVDEIVILGKVKRIITEL